MDPLGGLGTSQHKNSTTWPGQAHHPFGGLRASEGHVGSFAGEAGMGVPKPKTLNPKPFLFFGFRV